MDISEDVQGENKSQFRCNSGYLLLLHNSTRKSKNAGINSFLIISFPGVYKINTVDWVTGINWSKSSLWTKLDNEPITEAGTRVPEAYISVKERQLKMSIFAIAGGFQAQKCIHLTPFIVPNVLPLSRTSVIWQYNRTQNRPGKKN